MVKCVTIISSVIVSMSESIGVREEKRGERVENVCVCVCVSVYLCSCSTVSAAISTRCERLHTCHECCVACIEVYSEQAWLCINDGGHCCTASNTKALFFVNFFFGVFTNRQPICV